MIRFASRALLLIPFVAVISVLVLAHPGRPALAGAAFTIDSTTDAVDANPSDGVCATAGGLCTLRAAIMETNALPGADTITLPAGIYTLTIAGTGDDDGDAATGDLDVKGGATINGASAASTIVQGCDNSGGPCTGIDRIITIWSHETVTMSRVTIRNGNAGTRTGGGIANWGALELNESTVTANRSEGNCAGGIASFGGEDTAATITSSTISGNLAVCAGGIFNQGQLGVITIIDSTIRDNEATAGEGGGILNNANLTITGSTISGNHSTQGGGGIHNNADLTITNSTISGNTAEAQPGGGILATSSAETTLTNVTIANNTAVSEGAISTPTNHLTLKDTILAGNAPFNCAFDAVLTSAGHNLDSDGSCDIAGPGDLNNADPLLGPLADNGGPTETHPLLAGSPAIDAGDDAFCPFTDQRGFGRVGTCDIGAFEFGGSPVTVAQGDVNCDDEVSAVDALVILRVVAGLTTTAQCVDMAGDVNCDSNRTSVDALGVLRYVAGLPVNQNEPCADIGTPV